MTRIRYSLFSLFASAFVFVSMATDAFVAEPWQPFTTNRIFNVTASSNWIVVTTVPAGSVTTTEVFARRVPSDGRPYQRFTGTITGVAIDGDVLLIKDYYDTVFYRDVDGTWTPDGRIEGNFRTGAAGGNLVVHRDQLLSGSEIYEWPSRNYVQTLPLSLWNPTFVGLKLAGTYPINPPAVWLYENVGGLWTNAQRLPEPEGAQDTRFGSDLAQCSGFLLVGAPGDNAGATNSGAVHVYMADANGMNWFHHQKLKPALPMTGDAFGSVIVSEGSRVYVSAPHRNEERQGSGAIFVYELRANRASITFHEIAKVTYRNTYDNAALGLRMAVRNRIVYGLLGLSSFSTPTSIVAFHPPVRLTPRRFSESFGIDFTEADNAAAWESTTDLSHDWTSYTPVNRDTGFEVRPDQSSGFFRIVTPSAF